MIARRAQGRQSLAPKIWSGRLAGRKVVHITSGVGITNAAWAATVLAERFDISRMINFGIAGAYPGSGLSPGDVAVAEEEVYADTGIATAKEMLTMKDAGMALLVKGSRKNYNAFELDKKLLKKALPLVDASGRFLTVSQATGTLKRSKELEKKYGAIVENMEGAAVAHICARYGISALEIRGISNMVEKRDPSKWLKKPAATKCQQALISVIEQL
ncbi:MAG: futalosine hydrolase [Thermodesulfovibrionales bacterium]|nr:futalosine hydrolase [Thermodesulfovibrionales bacterium]